jgi:hypothetical protein
MSLRPHATLAPALAARHLQGLAAVYLHELELVTAGVPAGPLGLVPALRAAAARELLFATASQPDHRAWIERLHSRLVVDCGPAERDRLLALADEAQVAQRHRRAVQLYGWLMLTAREPDNAFDWAVRHLVHLSRTVYEPT